MKNKQWVVAMLAAAVLGGCVVQDQPRPVVVDQYGNPYLVGDGIDMGAPVYFSTYPDYVFYHRYDPYCDCIRIVRLVSAGGAVFWVDQFGKRVHEGHWEPSRPTPHALHGYRSWSQQHRAEFHHRPPPGHRGPPPQPVVAPAHDGHRDHGPGPAVRPPVPQPAVAPVVAPARPGQPGAAVHADKPGKGDRPGKPGKGDRPNRPGKADQPAKPAPAVQPAKPAPAVQPAKPAPAAQPAKPASARGDAPGRPAGNEGPKKKCPDDKKDC